MAVALTDDRVCATIFRERYEFLERYYGWTLAEVARDLNYMRKRSSNGQQQADSQKVAKLLEQDFVDYDTACALCRALDIDPHEAGV